MGDIDSDTSLKHPVFAISGGRLFRWSLADAQSQEQGLKSSSPTDDLWQLPDGRLLVTFLDDAPRVYDKNLVLQATLGTISPFGLAVHPVRDLILTYDGPNDPRLKQENLPNRYNDQLVVWSASGDRVTSGKLRLGASIAFHPTEAVFAASPWRTEDLLAWDLETKRDVFAISLGSHASCLAFSPDGASVAVGTVDKRVRVFSFPGGKPLFEFRRCGIPTALCFDQRDLVAGSKDGKLRRITFGSKSKWVTIKTALIPHLDSIMSLASVGGVLISRDRSAVFSVFHGGNQRFVGLHAASGAWAALTATTSSTDCTFSSSIDCDEITWGYHENHIGPIARMRIDRVDRGLAHLTYTKTFSPRGEARDTVERRLVRR